MYENAVIPEEKTRKEHPRLYFVTTKRFANYMLQHGSKMLQVQNDKFRPGRLVFVFMWDEVCDRNAKNWESGDRTTFIG